MSNNYPYRIFKNKDKAEEEARKCNIEDIEKTNNRSKRRIYYFVRYVKFIE